MDVHIIGILPHFALCNLGLNTQMSHYVEEVHVNTQGPMWNILHHAFEEQFGSHSVVIY